jgi:hypothetical protein
MLRELWSAMPGRTLDRKAEGFQGIPEVSPKLYIKVIGQDLRTRCIRDNGRS